MDEKTKTKHLSPPPIKIQDKIIKNKIQTLNKSISNLIIEQPYKFDIIYKNKELNEFKDDILSFIRERDNFYFEKFKYIENQTNNNNKSINNLSEVMESNLNTFLKKNVEIKTKLEKLKSFDAFINKTNDKLISHEIRINSLREDLTKSNQKYDKIYLDNLEVPGYIGRSSKYANCKIFFTEIIKEMEKFNLYRDKNIIDLSTYKDKLENIIKIFHSLVDNNNDSQIKYIKKLNDKIIKNLIETMEEKMKNIRMENSHFSLNLLKKSDDLNSLYDKINSIKENILGQFKTISQEYKTKVEDINKSFDDFKVEFEIIRKKFFELADFIKNLKYKRNLGSTLGRREISLISKNLNKELKDIIEPKDVKLFHNIKEIEKIDFTEKNTFEYKSNNNRYENNNNINNMRLSKSQNNFNHNNYIGKKKVFGFGNNIGNYTHKARYSIDYQKNGFKINQGLLVYNRSNDLNDNTNSVKMSLNKKILIKNNIKNNELNINTKNNILIKEKPKSQRQTGVQTDINNIINLNNEKNNENKVKSNKSNNSKEVKIIKLKKEEIEKIEENEKKKDIEKEKQRNKSNIINDDLSITESCISNINNSINTFSTTNEKNNSFNAMNINNKIGKFNLFESNLDHNDKIIKELASELEQSTAKVNKLGSNKKEVEQNFKLICNKIQPINLKLNNIKLEKIDEFGEKNILTNKSDQNTTILTHNLNKIINNKTNNSNYSLTRNNKLRELVDLTEKPDNSNNPIKIDKSKEEIKNTENISNKSINYNNIDKRMNTYDKKLGDLESFTKDQIFEMIKQIDYLKKNYTHLINIIKLESKNIENLRLNGYKTNKSVYNSPHSIGNINTNNSVNNENKNILNLSTINLYKKSPSVDYNPRLLSNSKKVREEINLSDNLFYNGKYYFNIKDILSSRKDKSNTSNYQFDNKRLLKEIEKMGDENIKKTKTKILKNNSFFEGNSDNNIFNLNKLGTNYKIFNKTQRP